MITRSMVKKCAAKEVLQDKTPLQNEIPLIINQFYCNKMKKLLSICSAMNSYTCNMSSWTRVISNKYGSIDGVLPDAEFSLRKYLYNLENITALFIFLNRVCKNPHFNINNMSDIRRRFWTNTTYDRAHYLIKKMENKVINYPQEIITDEMRRYHNNSINIINTYIKFIDDIIQNR